LASVVMILHTAITYMYTQKYHSSKS